MVQRCRRNVSVEADNTRSCLCRRCRSIDCFVRRTAPSSPPRTLERFEGLLADCHDRRPWSQYVLDVGDTLVGLVGAPAPNAALDA